MYLLLKHVENGAGRLTGLKLGGEWMGKKVVLCLLFVGFQGVTKNKLEVWRRGAGRMRVRHESEREMLVCTESAKKRTADFVGVASGERKGKSITGHVGAAWLSFVSMCLIGAQDTRSVRDKEVQYGCRAARWALS